MQQTDLLEEAAHLATNSSWRSLTAPAPHIVMENKVPFKDVSTLITLFQSPPTAQPPTNLPSTTESEFAQQLFAKPRRNTLYSVSPAEDQPVEEAIRRNVRSAGLESASRTSTI